jgi:translocator protein
MAIKWGLLIGFIILCNLIGSIGALWNSSDGNWFKDLKKPNFNPPNWIFGPVWTLLFTLMGITLYIVWTAPSSEIRTIALALFWTQFIFNVLWSYLFFGIHNPFLAFIEIILLLILIIATGIYFYSVNRFAGYLLIPYFLWVIFASFLNYTLWKLN